MGYYLQLQGIYYPAKTINAVRAWVAQQQSQKSSRDTKKGAFRAEFEITARPACPASRRQPPAVYYVIIGVGN